jgi:precorrin-4/cobalt-precorrin-4 C11-methyltransferase
MDRKGREVMTTEKHPIIFCGAGPGDPDLITVKGMKALESADLVLYAGSLVPEAVLTWASAQAKRISSADLDLELIVETMVQAYHRGKCVVRLHTGDPSLYGAIREQMESLKTRGIPYLVIPGVTAAFAAAAAMGLEYTIPQVTQTLILTRMAGRTPVPETESLASLARHGASLVIYLSMGLVGEAARILSDAYGPDAMCAVAYRVSQPEEKIINTPIKQLVQTVQADAIHRLAVIMVGPALNDSMEAGTLRSKLYDKEFTHGYRSGT